MHNNIERHVGYTRYCHKVYLFIKNGENWEIFQEWNLTSVFW